MQAAQRVHRRVLRHGCLLDVDVDAVRRQLAPAEMPSKETALVGERLWLDDVHALERLASELHRHTRGAVGNAVTNRSAYPAARQLFMISSRKFHAKMNT